MTNDNLRVVLDSIELNGEAKAELDQTIAILKNENIALQITIQSLKRELEIKDHDLKNYTEDIDDDKDLLKEMIVNQRREIREKDDQLEMLRDVVEKLSTDLENVILNKESEYNLSDIPGIGPRIEQKLTEIGIDTAYDLMDADVEQLANILPGIGIKSIKKWKRFLLNRDKQIWSQYKAEQ